MFNINFIRLLNNFSLKRETADMAIRSWKSENKEIYQQFKSNIEKIKDGDVSHSHGDFHTYEIMYPSRS